MFFICQGLVFRYRVVLIVSQTTRFIIASQAGKRVNAARWGNKGSLTLMSILLFCCGSIMEFSERIRRIVFGISFVDGGLG